MRTRPLRGATKRPNPEEYKHTGLEGVLTNHPALVAGFLVLLFGFGVEAWL